MSTTISEKKLKELLEIQKKYKGLQKIAKSNKKVKTVLDKNEQKQKIDKTMANMKRQTTRINNQITKVNKQYKQALPDFGIVDSAFKNTLAMYKTTEKHTTTNDDPQIFMKNIKRPTTRFLKYKLNDDANLKVQSILWVEFVKIIDSFNKAKQRGTGWEFNKIESYQLRVADWQPLKGSSYCPLPEKINVTKAVINIKNTKDNECFKWVLMRADFPKVKNPQRINDLQKIWKANPSLYNFDGIEFPVKISDISRFEKLNNKKINVFECNTKGDRSPVYLSSEQWNATDLLLYNEHYSLIKNFNRLHASLTKHQHKLFVCKCC